ncbi:MAG TPA: hypothetical protein VL947_06910 [Cytophagales bacterium]|nr:hypothetical protein [Cytophagales bacterium]
MKKIESYILTAFLAINLFTYFIAAPYAQTTANSHINNGPALGNMYFLLSIATFIIFATVLRYTRNIRLLAGLLLVCISILYWGYRLHSIYCLGCHGG